MESKSGKRICPRCRATQLHRSQMRGVVERSILRPVGIRAYRCAACDRRFLRFGGSGDKPVNSDEAASVKAE
jgi:transposase-like protein